MELGVRGNGALSVAIQFTVDIWEEFGDSELYTGEFRHYDFITQKHVGFQCLEVCDEG